MSYARPLLFALLLPSTLAQADPPPDATAMDQRAALDCVSTRYRGEPLRIRGEDDGLVQEVRWVLSR